MTQAERDQRDAEFEARFAVHAATIAAENAKPPEQKAAEIEARRVSNAARIAALEARPEAEKIAEAIAYQVAREEVERQREEEHAEWLSALQAKNAARDARVGPEVLAAEARARQEDDERQEEIMNPWWER